MIGKPIYKERVKGRVNWNYLSSNTDPRLIPIFEKNIFKLNLKKLSGNPIAVSLLQPDMINWKNLSKNPSAVHILKKNIDKIDWYNLSNNSNPDVIPLLEQEKKGNWSNLSKNPVMIPLLERNLNKIVWKELSRNPKAVHLLKQNIDKIDWEHIASNPNPEVIPLIEQHLEDINNYSLISSEEQEHNCEKNGCCNKKHNCHICCCTVSNINSHNKTHKHINNLQKIKLNKSHWDEYCWYNLGENPNAIHLIRKNWSMYSNSTSSFNSFCGNPNSSEILRNDNTILSNLNYYNWNIIIINCSDIEFIDRHIDIVKRQHGLLKLTLNKNPNISILIKKYVDQLGEISDIQDYDAKTSRIYLRCAWAMLSEKDYAFDLLFELDYKEMTKSLNMFCKELNRVILNPARLERFANEYNMTFEEYLDCI